MRAPVTTLTLSLTAALLLLAGPAAAQDEVDAQPADYGFPIALAILAVVASVFAVVWWFISRRKQRQNR